MAQPNPQPRPRDNSPESFDRDLHPNRNAGQYTGDPRAQPFADAPTADQLKYVIDHFPDLSADELKELRIIPAGHRLEQGATYLDLKNLAHGEFTAMGDMTATRDNWYIAKRDTPYQLWNRLIGIKNKERLGEE